MSASANNAALSNAIASWDGKTTSDLEEIGAKFSTQGAYLEDLVSLAANADLQRGATWLILSALKNGEALDKRQETALLDSLPLMKDWQARLHLLQSLPYFGIPQSCRRGLEAFVRDCLTASNKFVRAWAYSGLHELALRFPEYEKETAQILAMALKDEAPSVKARIRQLKPRGK